MGAGTSRKELLSQYAKRERSQTLIEKISVPVTPHQKARAAALKGKIDVNKYLRDKLDELLAQAG